MTRALLRRLSAVDWTGGTPWRSRPDPDDIRWEALTADECERAADVRERLDESGFSGIPDADLDFLICLNERLAGEHDAPCCVDGSGA